MFLLVLGKTESSTPHLSEEQLLLSCAAISEVRGEDPWGCHPGFERGPVRVDDINEAGGASAGKTEHRIQLLLWEYIYQSEAAVLG